MSTVKVNTVQDANGGSNAQIYGVASPPNSMGFRNRIINGGMVVDQRNASAGINVAAGTLQYTVDRWAVNNDTDAVLAVIQDTAAPTGFRNSLKVTVSTADASIGATQNAYVGQQIEGLNVADFAFGTSAAATVTLSFRVRSSLTGTFGGILGNSALDRSYPFTYTISAANTWETKTITIAGDTTGTWLNTTGIGLRVWFAMGTGSTYLGPAGSWAAAQYRGATGQTQIISTVGATWQVTGVQLEAGTNASEFEARAIGQELALCQRYYQPIFVDYGTLALCRTTAIATFAVKYVVEMRATASYTFPTYPLGWATNDGGNRTTTSLGTSGGSSTTQGFVVNGSGLTSNQMLFNFNAAVAALASAEL